MDRPGKNAFAQAFVLTFALLLGTAACHSEARQERTVAVEVTYAEPPPPASTIDIRVVEVSGPDRAIAGSMSAPASLAGPFRVVCPAGKVRESQQYGLEIHVVQNGVSILRNRDPFYVLTRGNPDHVSVPLVRK